MASKEYSTVLCTTFMVFFFFFSELHGREQLGASAKRLLLCSTEEGKSYRFWQNVIIFGVNYPLKGLGAAYCNPEL